MDIPVGVRSAALVASAVITFGIVELVALQALPEATANARIVLAASACPTLRSCAGNPGRRSAVWWRNPG